MVECPFCTIVLLCRMSQQGPAGGGVLHLAPGVDLSDAETLAPDLFKGVSQVVSAVGPRFGRQEDGSMG
eukprot:scaffold382063_cov25-Prasinocladus_malaysianus.AAC.1